MNEDILVGMTTGFLLCVFVLIVVRYCRANARNIKTKWDRISGRIRDGTRRWKKIRERVEAIRSLNRPEVSWVNKDFHDRVCGYLESRIDSHLEYIESFRISSRADDDHIANYGHSKRDLKKMLRSLLRVYDYWMKEYGNEYEADSRRRSRIERDDISGVVNRLSTT